MKRRDIVLDFTSLLDIILIILFFFILFSHMEVADSRATAEAQMAKAQSMHEKAEGLAEQLEDELEMIRQTDPRRADNAQAMLEFGRSQNVKLILTTEDGSWELNILCNDEVVSKVPADSDIGAGIIAALEKSGYSPDNTLFCEFVLNGSEAGTASAYRAVNKAIKTVRETYRNLYFSETDLSIVEE